MKRQFKKIVVLLTLVGFFANCQNTEERGVYFSKKAYDGSEIPVFKDSKDKLPKPILEDNQDWVDLYYKTWELAFDHYKKPPEGSPFVSNILDEAFGNNIFQWDMIFMVMFARYGHDVFPAVSSLDNFYCRQYKSGYICREIEEEDGSDFVTEGRKNTINPPLFSWAEIESFKNTGETKRFKDVLPVLEKYVEWLNRDGTIKLADNKKEWENYGRRAAKSVHQLYWNTPFGSGMDNTPRGGNGWVDMSCQMVIQYNNLAKMAEVIGDKEKKDFFESEAKKIADRINKYCWNEEDGLYYDVDKKGRQVKHKTLGCFWPMLAQITSPEQNEKLVANLTDPNLFWRKIVFPTLGAGQKLYNPEGGYWLGGVWAPTNYMVIKGLEVNGYEEIARKASLNYITGINEVYKKTGTVWENYAPDSYSEGDEEPVPDFVGWTGIGPIALLIENVLGFRVDAVNNTLTWHITRTDKHGIENLKVGDITVNAICEKQSEDSDALEINISTTDDLKIILVKGNEKKEFSLVAGQHSLKM